MVYKNVFSVASFFVQKGVSPLQLQKLLYYSQVWFFVKNDKKLFNDQIKAWIYGPVVPKVWQTFKYMRRTDQIPTDRLSNFQVDSDLIDHLDQIWKSYGHLSGSQLVDLTHNELPWRTSRTGLLDNQPSITPVIINKKTTINYRIDKNGNIPIVSIKDKSLGIYSSKSI